MKKCFIILALMLMLTCAWAQAEVREDIPWMDEAETIALFEAYYGRYTDWPTDPKNAAEFYLVWVGALEESEDTRKLSSEEYMNLLSDEELSALIDSVICGGLGLAPEEIDTLALVQCVWGEQQTWNEERAAFWAALQEKLARIDGYAPEKRETRLRQMLGLEGVETELELDIRALSSELAAQECYSFGSWPLEIKAMFTQEFAPRIRRAIEEDEEYVYPGNAALAVYDYGLPSEGELSEEAAREAALDAAAAAFGMERDAFTIRYDFFDVTDAEKPLWRVDLLSQGEESWSHDEWRVQLDARTGELVEAGKLPLAYQVTRWENWLNSL